ncbi:MAG: PAS domain-containing protein [Opitutaceae bacterium]|nr:PAS domain-containing protein [Verrucomicrobiales bacterium]
MDETTTTGDGSTRDCGLGIQPTERDFLQAVLDNIPDSVYFKDKDSRFIHCSSEVVSRLGLSSVKDVLGRTDADFFSPEHAAITLEDERRIMRTGNSMIGVVERETRLNGAVNWVLTTKVAFRDRSGVVIGTFGISRDITDLKKSQEDQANEKELLAVTLKSIGDVVVTTDTAGAIVLFNKAAEDLTSVRQAQARGRRLDEIMTLVDQQTRRPIENPIHKVIDHRSHYGRSNNVILRMPDGMDRVLALTGAPIFDNEGKISGVVLAFHDMTEKQRIETEIFKASKLESVGTLAGGIAHDFNNILTTIIGNLSLAKMPGMDAERLQGRIGDAERAALRARELTHRLLTFSKGGAPIKKSIELGPLIEGVVHSTLRGGNVVSDIVVPADLWTVEVDEGQMKHVINHLTMNARDAMSEGGKVTIKAENVEIKADFLPTLAAGSCVKITVRDTGAGIAPEHLSRIFDPYFTTKEQGAGLGLATSYSVIRKHDGIIQVDSLPGIGTVFTIYLRASKKGTIPVLENRLSSLMGSGRVLLMDDEADIRTVGMLILQTIGYEVELARDGAECIERYLRARSEGHPFDVIILDLTISNGMGGKETIRRLRGIDPNVKAIVSSGYSLDPVMANFREYGFNGIVPKPYKIEDMAIALKELLRP